MILRYEDQPAMVTSSSEVVVIHPNIQQDRVLPQDRAKTQGLIIIFAIKPVILGYRPLPDPKKGIKNQTTGYSLPPTWTLTNSRLEAGMSDVRAH